MRQEKQGDKEELSLLRTLKDSIEGHFSKGKTMPFIQMSNEYVSKVLSNSSIIKGIGEMFEVQMKI